MSGRLLLHKTPAAATKASFRIYGIGCFSYSDLLKGQWHPFS